MKKYAVSVVEFILIGALVAVITVAFWGKISTSITKLAGLSSVQIASLTTGSSGTNSSDPSGTNSSDPSGTISSSKTPDDLIGQAEGLVGSLDPNSPNYINKRTETVGTLGNIISIYNDTQDSDLLNELVGLIQDLAKTDGNNNFSDSDAQACVSSPSSCTTLMTVTDFNWSADNPNNTYYDSDGEKPIYGQFNYDVTYLDNQGKLQTTTITQETKIQKEQLTGYINKGYTEYDVLSQYMPTAYSDSEFTGSAVNVQEQLNSYMTGQNCELSKSESDYVCFNSLGICQ